MESERHAKSIQVLILCPKKTKVDLELNACKPRLRPTIGGYHRSDRDSELRDLVQKKRDAFEADATGKFHRSDLERICERVVAENLVEKVERTTHPEEYKELYDYALPYSDDAVALISGVYLLLGDIHLAKYALTAVDKSISGSVVTAGDLTRFAFSQLHT